MGVSKKTERWFRSCHGFLSPKTRNSQVELYQSGDVDYLEATDAIGMGLNMDINDYFSNIKNLWKNGRLTQLKLPKLQGELGDTKMMAFLEPREIVKI